MYCEQDIAGGGWTLVANVASSGSWMPGNPNLMAAYSFGTFPSDWVHNMHYYRSFTDIESRVGTPRARLRH